MPGFTPAYVAAQENHPDVLRALHDERRREDAAITIQEHRRRIAVERTLAAFHEVTVMLQSATRRRIARKVVEERRQRQRAEATLPPMDTDKLARDLVLRGTRELDTARAAAARAAAAGAAAADQAAGAAAGAGGGGGLGSLRHSDASVQEEIDRALDAGKMRAITKIQAARRSQQVRQTLNVLRQVTLLVQSHVRRYRAQRAFRAHPDRVAATRIQSAARGTASMKVVKLLLSVAFRHASRVTYHDDIFPVSKCVRGDGGG